jgi:hypothetical protein
VRVERAKFVANCRFKFENAVSFFVRSHNKTVARNPVRNLDSFVIEGRLANIFDATIPAETCEYPLSAW